MTDITEDAIRQGMESFMATTSRVPPNFALLAEPAPGAFAGYGLMRGHVTRDTDQGGALDLRTKELVFALLDTLVGQTHGVKVHAAKAMRLGLTLPQLAEALVQVMMVGGVTSWNVSGAEVLRHCAALER